MRQICRFAFSMLTAASLATLSCVAGAQTIEKMKQFKVAAIRSLVTVLVATSLVSACSSNSASKSAGQEPNPGAQGDSSMSLKQAGAKFLDIVRQADFWARQDGMGTVDAKHVDRALDEHEYRSALVRDRMQQMIDDGSMFIATSGAVVGQVNALSVIQLGDAWFGHPSRVTASVRMGRGEVVDIEREVELGGPIHSKGVLILSGFLGARFGVERPLAFHASPQCVPFTSMSMSGSPVMHTSQSTIPSVFV